jgi:hypothetical protein
MRKAGAIAKVRCVAEGEPMLKAIDKKTDSERPRFHIELFEKTKDEHERIVASEDRNNVVPFRQK